MAEFRKHALLLSFMAVLIVAKFIFVPIFDWQNKQLQSIKLLEKKQQKMTSVLTSKNETNEANTSLIKINSVGESFFFPYQTESAFKLKQQKMLETLVTKHKVQIERIAWQVITVFEDLSVKRYQLQLSIKGKTNQVVELFSAFENNEKLIDIKNFNVSFKGQRENTLGQLSGNLTLQLYVINKA
ncbi:hypothetical protein [Pseudoalteromonas denitrificans]|uniref:Type II secretion system (T2SS), protein M subtype b n=1 Tax=Pseudoalteromonas denitrificans DSM 6059 TaxID=1123010 RepID=A0A1I1JUL9_9GAMM|nr:hypothetical protein [Pseudoalteromonas denitrificans]SFC52347.1 hypothetical protein SAMN02745724_01853 [Pseudoalteromonas denitrificans DSM 6059]